jgi:dTDP-L-rhamnose 4-epimerase
VDTILVTGGAGFLGSHLADELLRCGHRVRALDVLSPQVHPGRLRPSYLAPDVELLVGDVRDAATVERALLGVDAVVHFAAAVGVGQSMYAVEQYTSVNNVGTAVLMEALIKRPVRKLVVASSMSVYGEGLFHDAWGRVHDGRQRTLEQLKRGDWEVRGDDSLPLRPVPTPETKSVALESIYALSKYDQERMCTMLGRAYGIPTVALRFFDVFGPRQALSNPYTGVLAIFAARLLNGHAPLVFEDGQQQRDFVSVYDAARACRLALEKSAAAGRVVNIGSGQPRTIRRVAVEMASALGKPHIAPEITGKYRVGDVRHCFADLSEAKRLLGFTPQIEFERGLAELASWLAGQVARDRVAEARAELEARGLTL